MLTSLLGLWLAGVLTFASPCVLPLMPAYFAALGAGAEPQRRGRFVVAAALFALGVSLVFILLGAGASALGARLVAHRGALLLVSGALMLLFGLRALGVFRLPILDRDARPGLTRVRNVSSLAGAFLFGVAFAIGWSPCVGPVLASALAYAASHAATPLRGAALLAVYASGFALPLLALSLLAERGRPWLARSRAFQGWFERASGALLIAVGVFTLLDASGALAPEGTRAAEAPCAAASASGCALPTEPRAGAKPIEVHGPALLEFTAANCPLCKQMAPVLAEAEAACSSVGVSTTRIDVGTHSGLELARSLAVVATPTFVLVGDNGVERARLVGVQPAAELESAIELTFGRRCQAELPLPSPSG